MNKHIIWAVTLFLITFMICSTIIYINYNSWTLRFEMDDNTREAIESIEFDEIGIADSCWICTDGCNICCGNPDGIYTSTLMYCGKYVLSEGEGK